MLVNFSNKINVIKYIIELPLDMFIYFIWIETWEMLAFRATQPDKLKGSPQHRH